MAHSLVEILRRRAGHQPKRLAYRFLPEGEGDAQEISYAELDLRARALAAMLQATAQPGDRALLMFPPGIDFIAAYFGCLYAKVIAIPVHPPHPVRLGKTLTKPLAIAADADPAVVLLTSGLFNAIQARPAIREQFKTRRLLVTDRPGWDSWAKKWQNIEITGDDLAFLQYTSGSTHAPKGVKVTHRNLMHNLKLIETSFGQTPESRTVIWLPPYHDMGLIGGILQPLFTGNPVTLMPHLMFLQRPLRWLQAITRYQATTSGGPNFAFDLCVRKVKPEQREQLDLSHWNLAFNGAEPIHPETLENFATFFAPCGFRKEAFTPCYGLAEGTLMVTGGPPGREPLLKTIDKNGSRTLVSSGQNLGGQRIEIVDPESKKICPPGKIGEVWVQGESVAAGYWHNPEATQTHFRARLAGDPSAGFFLRTGDLGLKEGEEVFITGRLKNLIIIDGKNHYPHDIERTLERCHPAIRPTGCAVFSNEGAAGEEIIVVAEMQPKLVQEAQAIEKAIRTAVAEHHDLHVHDLRLCLPGGIPRTTSGKIKHFLLKEQYLAETLKEITLV